MVFTESPSSAAADRLVWPSAMSTATRRSASVRDAHPVSARAVAVDHLSRRCPGLAHHPLHFGTVAAGVGPVVVVPRPVELDQRAGSVPFREQGSAIAVRPIPTEQWARAAREYVRGLSDHRQVALATAAHDECHALEARDPGFRAAASSATFTTTSENAASPAAEPISKNMPIQHGQSG